MIALLHIGVPPSPDGLLKPAKTPVVPERTKIGQGHYAAARELLIVGFAM
jgi:hypothetical protein